MKTDIYLRVSTDTQEEGETRLSLASAHVPPVAFIGDTKPVGTGWESATKS